MVGSREWGKEHQYADSLMVIIFVRKKNRNRENLEVGWRSYYEGVNL